MADHTGPVCYRFGAFEADLSTGELRRQGARIKLHAQPFQLLSLLLARPGEVLTRDELARELWPDGTFVDAEQGLNSAINRLRDALGDRASHPRFVETLSRRGYRFVAPVERVGSTPAPQPAKAQAANPAAARPDSAPPAPPAISRRRSWLATAEDLPSASYGIVQTLFVSLQLMYLAFYVGALANLAEISQLCSLLPVAGIVFLVILTSAAILIPVRAFLLCAAFLKPPHILQTLLKLWPFLLVADVAWALSPFLLLHHINYGLALACTALLLYSPFAQRSLVLMGAGQRSRPSF